MTNLFKDNSDMPPDLGKRDVPKSDFQPERPIGVHTALTVDEQRALSQSNWGPRGYDWMSVANIRRPRRGHDI